MSANRFEVRASNTNILRYATVPYYAHLEKQVMDGTAKSIANIAKGAAN